MRTAAIQFLLIGFSVVPLACTEPRPPLRVTDPDPDIKIPAMKKAVRERDLSGAASLVRDLDDDDPAVRFYAIATLHRLTNEDLGYHYYEDEKQRQPAIARWQKWLDEQRATTRSSAPGASTS